MASNPPTDHTPGPARALGLSDSPAPRYYRLWAALCARLQAGEFPVGSLMPTEAALCAEYGLGRITVRRALTRLQEEGVIERTQGRGSVVVKLPPAGAGVGAVSSRTEIAILAASEIGLVETQADNWGTNILRVTTGLFVKEGFHCTIAPFDPTGTTDMQAVCERLQSMRPRLAGVLGIGSSKVQAVHEFLDGIGIPWVSINPSDRHQTHNFVSARNHEGGMRIGCIFARQGVRSAIFLGPLLESSISAEEKFNGMLRAWIECGNSPANIRYLEAASGTQASMEELDALLETLRETPGPHGLFCAGDILASQAMRVIQESGMRIPADVVVVGSTGLLLAEHTSPTLTVLGQPMRELGEAAEAMLVDMIRTGARRVPGKYLSSPLVFRESCLEN